MDCILQKEIKLFKLIEIFVGSRHNTCNEYNEIFIYDDIKIMGKNE